MACCGHATATGATTALHRTTSLLGSRNAVAWRELNLQLDDFIPLLVRSVPFGDGQQLTQTTVIVVGRWGDGG